MSWVVLKDGKPVLETYNPAVAKLTPRKGVEVLTALQWLQRFNASVAA